jgi:CRP-like cAMP-binding protein
MELATAKNVLLRGLSPADRARLGPHFEHVPLAFKQLLHEQGKPVEHVYFPESGVTSMLTLLEAADAIETGTVGNEGFVGISAVLGAGESPNHCICQIEGSAFRLPAHVAAAERDAGTEWFRLLLRYVCFLTTMTMQSTACNRMHAVDARMSRWLLMTHDRVEGNEFTLTQEFLAQMLGVARPTVNIAGATLQRAGFIRYTRGRITILDRANLETAACECYERIRTALERTLQIRMRKE